MVRLLDDKARKMRTNKNPNYMDKADVLGKISGKSVDYRNARKAHMMATSSKPNKKIFG